VYDSSVNRKDLNNLFCVDVLVRHDQSNSLHFFLKQALPANLQVKVRLKDKLLPVYVLRKRTDTTLNLPLSKATAISYSFSGNGFKGEKMTLSAFAAHYLTNELDLPVIDETGL
jgi:hypothetical protein